MIHLLLIYSQQFLRLVKIYWHYFLIKKAKPSSLPLVLGSVFCKNKSSSLRDFCCSWLHWALMHYCLINATHRLNVHQQFSHYRLNCAVCTLIVLQETFVLNTLALNAAEGFFFNLIVCKKLELMRNITSDFFEGKTPRRRQLKPICSSTRPIKVDVWDWSQKHADVSLEKRLGRTNPASRTVECGLSWWF